MKPKKKPPSRSSLEHLPEESRMSTSAGSAASSSTANSSGMARNYQNQPRTKARSHGEASSLTANSSPWFPSPHPSRAPKHLSFQHPHLFIDTRGSVARLSTACLSQMRRNKGKQSRTRNGSRKSETNHYPMMKRSKRSSSLS